MSSANLTNYCCQLNPTIRELYSPYATLISVSFDCVRESRPRLQRLATRTVYASTGVKVIDGTRRNAVPGPGNLSFERSGCKII